MKKIISILLIVTMLLSMFVFVIPASATTTTTVTNNGDGTITVTTKDENENVISTITVPNSVDIATGANTGAFLGATSQTKPGLSGALTLPGANDLTITGPTAPVGPTAPSLGTLPTGTVAGVTLPNVSSSAGIASGVTLPGAAGAITVPTVGNTSLPAAGKVTRTEQNGTTVTEDIAVNADGKITNVGNVVIKDSAAYINKLKETYGDKLVEIKNGTSPTWVAGNYYYLSDDITVSSYWTQLEGLADIAKGITIDGCGHTITLNLPLMQKPYNLTVKNVTFEGSITDTSGGGKKYHSLSVWESKGYLNLENVTFSVDFSLKNTASSSFTGAICKQIGNGASSTWNNVLAEGTYTILEGTTRIEYAGGLSGSVQNSTLKSVVSDVDFVVQNIGNSGDDNADYLGGITGYASGSTFENVYNYGSLTVSNLNGKNPYYVGGLVGKADNCTFTNCSNFGSISINATSKIEALGGLIGGGYGTVNGCVNEGNITINKADNSGNETGIGGIYGVVSKGQNATIKNSYNKGTITFADAALTKHPTGGILGIFLGNELTVDNCRNDGAITRKGADNGGGAVFTAGIVGSTYNETYPISTENKKLTITNCTNNAAITDNGAYGQAVAGIVSNITGIRTAKIENCTNTENGVITAHSTKTWGGASGIVVLYRSVGGSWFMESDLNIWKNDKTKDAGFTLTLNNLVNKGAITNDAVVTGDSSHVAGIIADFREVFAGSANSAINITNCYNTGNLSSTRYAAGIVANAWSAGNALPLSISNCYNTGNVSGAGSVAGIVANGEAAISNCINTGAISASGTSSYVAGIAGQAKKALSNCYNTGSVTATGSVNQIAGIVAYASAAVSNCKNTGNVSAGKIEYEADGVTVKSVTHVKAKDIAGIVGNTSAAVEKCVNEGKIVATKGLDSWINKDKVDEVQTKSYDHSYGNVSGVVGSTTASVSNCYNAVGGTITVINTEEDKTVTVTYTEGGTQKTQTTYPNRDRFRIGGIVGYTSNNISNCVNDANITTSYRNYDRYITGVGGIVGASDSNMSLTYSKNSGNITVGGNDVGKSLNVGGVLGLVWGGTVTVNHCANTGNITMTAKSTTSDGVGGIVGQVYNTTVSTNFTNCFNDGNITLGGSANMNVGGIVGFFEQWNPNTASATYKFENCYNGLASTATVPTGVITINSGAADVGGIVGRVHIRIGYTFTGTYNNCYNLGNIKVTGSTWNVGGIAGEINVDTKAKTETTPYEQGNNPVTVGSIYNLGNINLEGTSADAVGGVIGKLGGANPGIGENPGWEIDTIYNMGTLTVKSGTVNYLGGVFGIYGGGLHLKRAYSVPANGVTIDVQAGTVTYIGGVVGATGVRQASDGTTVTGKLEGCVNKGNIQVAAAAGTAQRIGGIAGYQDLNAVSCYNSGNITIGCKVEKSDIYSGVGGISGFAWQPVESCVNEGIITVSGTALNVGGIGGYIHHSVTKSKNTGAINVSGTVTNVGGIRGFSDGGNTANCENSGAITITGTATYVGGIVGQSKKDITTSKNTGNISAGKVEFNTDGSVKSVTYASASYIGGVAGSVTTAVSNCENSGAIVATKGSKDSFYAGVVGYTQGNVSNCLNKATGTVTVVNTDNSEYKFRVGGVVGFVAADNKEVKNCENQADVYANFRQADRWIVGTGGVLGAANPGMDLQYCANSGNVTLAGYTSSQDMNVGGVAGIIWGGDVQITHCKNTGTVTYDAYNNNDCAGVGGILGLIWGNSTLNIANCFNDGDLILEKNSDKACAGGILGSARSGTNTVTISNCHNGYYAAEGTTTGNIIVRSTKANRLLGGICGQVYEKSLSVNNCTNAGNITVNAGSTAEMVAGITARAQSAVSNCYNYGDITIAGTATQVGGVIGSADNANTTVTSCYNEGAISVSGTAANVAGIAGIASAKVSKSLNKGNITVSGTATNVAGIVAEAAAAVSGCQNEGTITVSGTVSNSTGGIIGTATVDGIVVSDCQNKGAVTIKSAASGNTSFIGGISGKFTSKNGELKNCVNDAKITIESGAGSKGTGGITGKADNNGIKISYCYNSANGDLDIQGGSSHVGGIGADCWGTPVTFDHCYNDGDITIGAGRGDVGGIAGVGRTNITNCTNAGNITVSKSCGNLGGITAGSDDQRNVNNCVNTGNITVTGTAKNVAGIIALVQQNNAADKNINNCYNSGNITISGTANSVAGIAAYVNKDVTINKVTNAGKIEITNCAKDNSNGVGGIVGYINNDFTVTISNAYNACESISVSGATSKIPVGGILGQSKAKVLTIDNCQNDANLSNTAMYYANGTNTPVAGIFANAYDGNGKGEGTAITVINCTNLGDVTHYGGAQDKNNNNVMTSPTISTSGVVGSIRGIQTTVIRNCVNGSATDASKGTITANQDTESGKYISSTNYGNTAGILAAYGSVGNNWMMVNDLTPKPDHFDCYLIVEKVANYGDITSNVTATGGIFGQLVEDGGIQNYTKTDANGDPTNFIKITSALNKGTVSSSSVSGGIVALINNAVISVVDSRNEGRVSSSGASAGGITAYADKAGAITRCVNFGAVSSTNNSGGIAGYITAAATVTNCTNIGAISTTNRNVGGVAGEITGAAILTNCVNAATATVTSTAQSQRVGGIAGRVSGAAQFKNCANYADLAPAAKGWDDGGGDGNQGVGGIAGFLESGSNEVLFDGCLNEGDISSGEHGYYGLGGIVGTVWQNATAKVNDCVNKGAIEVSCASRIMTETVDNVEGPLSYNSSNTGSKSGSFWVLGAGGITGMAKKGAKLTVTNSNNQGTVTATQSSKVYNIGGIVGSVAELRDTLVIDNCDNSAAISVAAATGHNFVGAAGILGKSISTVLDIKNCENLATGTVTLTATSNNYNAGGIVGSIYNAVWTDGSNANDATSTIKNCANKAAISAYGASNRIGGIIGRTDNATDTIVDGCNNTGNFTAGTASAPTSTVVTVGGIVGYVNAGMTVKNLTQSGSITVYQGATATYAGIGGVIGAAGWINPINLLNVDVADTADIIVSGKANNVGGYIGDRWDGPAYIGDGTDANKCTNKASITVNGTDGNVGGMFGSIRLNNNNGVTMAYTYDLSCGGATVALGTDTANVNVGGAIGRIFDTDADGIATVINFTNNNDITARANNNKIGGVVGYAGGGKVDFNNCVNLGKIALTGTLTSGYAGGIAGYTEGTVNFTNCPNGGSIAVEKADDCTVKGLNVGGTVGRVNSGTTTIKNTTNVGAVTADAVRASDVKISGYLGGFIGSANGEVVIENSTVSETADITVEETASSYFVGGFIGESEKKVTVKDSTNYADLTMYNAADDRYNAGIGGIIARLRAGSSNGSLFQNVDNYGNITVGEGVGCTAIGGIIGNIWSNNSANDTAYTGDPNTQTVTIDNCHNYGNMDISTPGSTKSTIGSTAGGVLGLAWGCVDVVIENSTNDGNITLTDKATNWNVGGILGGVMNEKEYYPEIVINNCVNGANTADAAKTGTITVNATGNANAGIGGILGAVTVAKAEGTIKIFASANKGVIALNNAANYNVGGAVGYTRTAIEIDGFVNAIALAATKDSMTVGGVIGKATHNPVTVKNSGNAVAISSTGANSIVGGIVGYSEKAFTANNVTNSGNLTVNGENSHVAGILAYGSTANVNGAENTGVIKVNSGAKNAYVGGLFGYLKPTENSTIKNVENSGNITVDSPADNNNYGVGGIVGTIDESSKTIKVENATNYGILRLNENATSYAVGGIVGALVKNKVKITGSVNSGAKTGNESNGSPNYGIIVYGDGNSDATKPTAGIGGIVGYITEDTGVVIDGCRNTMRIGLNGKSQGYNFGGIVGLINNSKSENTLVTNCENSGYSMVTYAKGWERYGMGGIVGMMTTGSKNTVSNSTNNAPLIMMSGTDGYNLGGIVGANHYVPVVIDNCRNFGEITAHGTARDSLYNGSAGILGYNYSVDKTGAADSITITNTVNNATVKHDDADTTGTIGGRNHWIGGIVGFARACDSITIENVVNNGDVIAKNNETAGIIGTIGTYGTLDWMVQTHFDVSIKNAVNNGAITGASHAAGAIGAFRSEFKDGTYKINVENFVNNGAITTTNGSVSGVIASIGCESANYTRDIDVTIKNSANLAALEGTGSSGAALGQITGFSTGSLDVTVDGFINDGDIHSAAGGTGGVVGRVEATSEHSRTLHVTVKNVANYGDVTTNGQGVGGVVGYVYTKNTNTAEGANLVTVTNVLNAGDVEGSEKGTSTNVGGILGILDSNNAAGKLTGKLENVVNYGSVSGNDWNCSGILGQLAKGASATTTNAVNIGELISNVGVKKEAAIAQGTLENVYCYSGSVEKRENKITYIENIADAYAKAAEILDVAASTERFDAALALAAKYAENTEGRNPVDVKELKATVAAANAWAENFKIYNIEYNELGVATNITVATQSEINAQYLALVGEQGFGDMVFADLDKAIADADKFSAALNGVYLPDAWGRFTNALSNAKTMANNPNKLTSVYPGDAEMAISVLADSMNTLKDSKGGYIYSEADLKRFEGCEGDFYLMNDITVKAPIDSFKGTLHGNDYTVTLEGDKLFNNFEGAANSLTVKGENEKSGAIFGNATGKAEINNVRVDVKAFDSAVFFASAANGAEISVANVLVTGKATALVTPKAVIENGYLVGVEYYDATGAKNDKALASGIAAIEINKVFGENTLVQAIGKDSYPTIGTPDPTGSNVVKLDENGNVYNPFIQITDDGPAIEEKPEVVVDPDNKLLSSAIESASAIKADAYTETSWGTFQAALAAAKSVLADAKATQDSIDAATYALNVAIAGLTVKEAPEEVVPVDYTALKAALDAAKALNESKYTKDSWATLKAVLAAAESALTSESQIVVNGARTSIANAIAALVEVVETPAEEPNEPVEPSEEKGCGGVVGGAAIVMVAVLALGAGVSFKKKED